MHIKPDPCIYDWHIFALASALIKLELNREVDLNHNREAGNVSDMLFTQVNCIVYITRVDLKFDPEYIQNCILRIKTFPEEPYLYFEF